jgi:hypothetical protein
MGGTVLVDRTMRLAVLMLALAGCGAGNLKQDAGPDFSEIRDLAAVLDLDYPVGDPTRHPEPHTMRFNGGPVLKNLESWTVVWQGDEQLGERIHRFTDWMVNSDEYWIDSLGEYGVGKGKAMGVIVLPSAPPATIDDSAFSGLIKSNIAGGLFPAPNVNTIFTFVIPVNTKSTLYGSRGCEDYGGYHAETRASQTSQLYVPYSVNLQCPGFGQGNQFDGLTEVVSHEISEKATDPHPFTRPAWVTGGYPLGGEVTDLCAGIANTYTVVQDVADAGPTEFKYLVSRNWSNKAVKSGNTDPCQPDLGLPWYNVALDPIEIHITQNEKGEGGSTAFLRPFAYGDVGIIKWQLGLLGDGVIMSPSSGSSVAGDTFYVTFESKQAQPGTYPILLQVQSQRGPNTQWVSKLTVE